ncbi:MAG TPA: putative O-glycosylation ligase, exosortase A system-associated, partial [Rhodocyclaceae bacterium]|nr:putative O-glycosylation ligase, exosortase A system-associated [Rhodocyclaceae bacterium]
IQISLLSFAVGGTFLGLVNFDVPYYLVAIVGLLWRDCRKVPDAVTAPGAPAVPRPRPAGGL